MTIELPAWGEPDVLVVGGGPAGSTVAGLLAHRGFDTLLVDRRAFPRPKPCGECLNPGAVRALARLGLLERVESLGPARLRGWNLETSRGAAVRARFRSGVGGSLAIPRTSLDRSLLDAARDRGVHVRTGVRVERVLVSPSGDRPLVEGRLDGVPVSLRPRIVIGADGLRSVVARSVGAVRRSPRIRKVSLTCHVKGPAGADVGTLVLGSELTVGLAPVGREGGVWNVTVVVPGRAWVRPPSNGPQSPWGAPKPSSGGPQTLSDGPAAVYRSRLATLPIPWIREPEILAGPWASGPFDWPMRRATAKGVLLVGDAAGYFDPLTGQGIFRALRSAELASEAAAAVLAGTLSPARARRQYERRLRALVARGRRVQRAIEAVVTRGWLREPALRQLARRPALASWLIGITGDAPPCDARPPASAGVVEPEKDPQPRCAQSTRP